MRAVILEAAVSILASVAIVSATSAAPIDYTFSLAPQNNSGVAGSGTMVLNGTSLTVSLSGPALCPTRSMRAIFTACSVTLPPPNADTNHDGFIEPEGEVFAGPPIFDLPPSGTRNGYSTAPSGIISFTQTYDLTNMSLYDPNNMGLSLSLADIEGTTGGNTIPLIDRLVEIHGWIVPDSAAAVDGISAPRGRWCMTRRCR